jgi:hypothetical protein
MFLCVCVCVCVCVVNLALSRRIGQRGRDLWRNYAAGFQLL